MERIYDFNKFKAKYPDKTFDDFVRLYLNIDNRPDLDTSDVDLSVRLDGQDIFSDIVCRHVKGKDKIAIISDYDDDGVCGLAIMYLSLKTINEAFGNCDLIPLIPNRFTDGYGLNKRLVDYAVSQGCKLIVTVDNGIKANEAIEYAVSQGVDVIVTDHHQPGSVLPKCNLIVNPHIGNSQLKEKGICGAMTAFLLCRNLLNDNKLLTKRMLQNLAELAAIATITDVMELKKENRKIVKYLFNLMHRNEDANKGVSALMKKQGIGRYAFDTESVSYGLGPSLNAPGRLDTAMTSFNLLIEENPVQIETLTDIISELNSTRKQMTLVLKKEAMLQTKPDERVNVIVFNDVSEGIIGIIAGKICEETNNPVFVFTYNKEKNIYKGSGRAPVWCNLIETATKALNVIPDEVVGFGGHPGAMGLSLKTRNSVEMFKAQFDKCIRVYNKVEAEQKAIRFPEGMTLKDVKETLIKYEPFGQGFEEPLFVCRTPINYLTDMGEAHCRFSGFINGEETAFQMFFTNLDKEDYEGKMVDCFFKIHKDVAETVGTQHYTPYAKFVKII